MPAAPPEIDQIVSLKRIARSLGLSAATVAKMSARGDFPKPIALGVRKKLYLLSSIELWWRQRLGTETGRPFPLAPESSNGDDPD